MEQEQKLVIEEILSSLFAEEPSSEKLLAEITSSAALYKSAYAQNPDWIEQDFNSIPFIEGLWPWLKVARKRLREKTNPFQTLDESAYSYTPPNEAGDMNEEELRKIAGGMHIPPPGPPPCHPSYTTCRPQ